MLPREVREPARPSVIARIAIPDEGINFVSIVSQLELVLILRCL